MVRLVIFFMAALCARADVGTVTGTVVTSTTSLVANGTVIMTGLTAGTGGTPLCIYMNQVYSGGCGTTGSGVTSTGGVSGYIPVYTGATSITVSSIQDNGTTVTTAEPLTVSNNISGTQYYLGSTQIITAAGNIGNIGNIVNSGNTTTTGNISGGSYYLGSTQIITSGGNVGNVVNGVFSGLLQSATLTLTGLSAGSGTALCINAGVVGIGGCGTAYSGSGTANVLTKWTGSNSFGNSSITDNGTVITTSEALTVANNISGTNYYLGSTQIITSAGNVGNLVNAIFSGSVTAASVNTVVYAGAYNFAEYNCSGSGPIICTPGGPTGASLSAGSNTVTFQPVPPGMNGTNTFYGIYISGGTGAAETATVTGGSAVSRASSGTLTFTTAHTHTGAFQLTSSTSGVREAYIDAPAGSLVTLPPGNIPVDELFFDRQISVNGQHQGGATQVGLVGQTAFVPLTGVGGNLITIREVPHASKAGLEFAYFDVDLSAYPTMSGIAIQGMSHAHVHDIGVQFGFNAITCSSPPSPTPGVTYAPYNYFDHLMLLDTSDFAFVIDGDYCNEIHISDSTIFNDGNSVGAMAGGIKITRTDPTYGPAYYIHHNNIQAVSSYQLTVGIEADAPLPGEEMDIFSSENVLDGLYGPAVSLNNVSGLISSNDWFAATNPSSSQPAVLLNNSGASSTSFSADRFQSKGGSAWQFENGGGNVSFDSNTFGEIGGTYLITVPTGASNPVNLQWGKNGIYGNTLINDPTVLVNVQTEYISHLGLGSGFFNGIPQSNLQINATAYPEMLLEGTSITNTAAAGRMWGVSNANGSFLLRSMTNNESSVINQFEINPATAAASLNAVLTASGFTTTGAMSAKDLTLTDTSSVTLQIPNGGATIAGALNLQYPNNTINFQGVGGSGNAVFIGSSNEIEFNNYADTQNNLIIHDNGNVSVFGTLTFADGLPDIEQYGCTSGMADATSCMNMAIAANPAIRIPKGTWNVGTGGGNLTLHSNLLIVGDGPGTVIQRSGAIGSSLGLFDLATLTNVRVTGMLIDGGVTSPATLDYATSPTALQSSLTQNTTFWLHGGSNITLDNLTIQHTGGYAVIVDGTANNVSGVLITDSTFQNNRPFLFGTGSDLTYGSWNGGIIWYSNGSSNNIQNLAITNNQFRYMTGTAVFGGASALTLLNKNIAVTGNLFQDIGLDGILAGPVDGYTVAANNFLRIGYPSTSDNTTGTAKWYNACTGGTPPTPGNPCTSGTYQSIPPVAIDSTGLVLNFSVTGNTVVAHNGGCIDLDGAGYGAISGNQCYIPSSGDPEYSDAQPSNWGPAPGPYIATAGQNWMYGFNTGNTQNTVWGAGFLTISGNSLTGQGGGAIRLYSGKSDQVKNNLIYSASTVHYDPIVMGPQSSGTNQQACGNEVSNNRISYLGGTGIPAVYEDTQYAAFGSGCQNTVHDNTLVGNLSAFSKASTSESIYYGAQTIVSGTSTISQYLVCNSLDTATTNACVTNQLELSSGTYYDRWYSPSSDLMLTIGTDDALRIGDGSIGSLWLGGNLALDVTRNVYANSVSIGTYGSSPFLAISSVGTIAASTSGGGYYLGTNQIITPTGNVGNIGNIIATGNLQMNGNVAANSFYIYNPAGPGSAQIAQIYDTGGVACTATAPCANLANILNITAIGTVTAQTEVATPLLILGGNPVYRCVTAGSLPVGALTINSGNCGSIASTGIYSQ